MSRVETICFSLADLKRFGESSHDRNPLHLSETYARKSPYGSEVVFGVLGGITCLRYLQDRPNHHLVALKLDFPGAILLDIHYRLEIQESPEKAVARIYDGRRLLLKLVAQFQTGQNRTVAVERGSASLTEALSLTITDLQVGRQIEGTYCPASGLADELVQILEPKGINDFQLAALLWSSYLVGMELPGEQALFSKLSLQFQPLQSQSPIPLSYTATVADIDERFNLVQIQAKLTVYEAVVAEAKISAFVRSDSPVSTPKSIEAMLPRSLILQDQVALVIGGSRGLGAAIAQTLVLQGCTVFVNFARSKLEAEQLLADLANAPGSIILLQGDASDLEWCKAARHQIEKMYGRLDYLICNACPPILPTWLETNSIVRINNYVSLSLALMSTPMASFLDLLSESGGWNIVISSIYVSQQAPAELPHYVAAKCAIEGIAKVATTEYETVHHLIVRPPKLLTDQTNTPLSSQGAIASEVVAVKLVQCLVEKVARPGRIEILEQW